ncbi:MAG: 6,7-dimethyl-8-ribityllumazine synthase [Cytophagales bacterium]|nr:6,7-dimethyl-8-ribityllumazine synthase [Cytophagales bacterium]
MSTLLHKFTPSQKLDNVKLGFLEHISIVVSDWNSDITHKLLEGAVSTLKNYGVRETQIKIKHVPGSFELIYGARQVIINNIFGKGVIVLGCVIRGETPHFDYICQGVTYGIAQLNAISTAQPIILGVLTTDTLEQAIDRAGGKYGNKGEEAALTLINMMHAFNS